MFRKIKALLLENKTARQRVFKNSFWLSISNVFSRLIRGIIVIYAARVLGAEQWGVFSYAITLGTFFTIFTDLGIGSVITREVAKSTDQGEQSRIFSTSFYIKLVFTTLGILIITFIAPHFVTVKGVSVILPLVAFVLAFDNMREFGFSVVRAFERMELEAIITIATNVVIVTAGFIFLSLSATVKSFTYAYVFGTGAGAITVFILLQNKLGGLFSKFSKKLVKPIIFIAWPFALMQMLGALTINTDVVVLGFLKSAKDVGFFSAVQRPIQLLLLIPGMIATAIFPIIARLASTDKEKTRRIIEKSLTLTYLLIAPLVLGGIILGPQIVELLFGKAYLPAALTFQILMLTFITGFPNGILVNALFAYNRQKVFIKVAGITGITNVILDILFIPRWGIAGCAFGTILSQLIAVIILWSTLRKDVSFKLLPYVKTITISSIAMAIVVFLLLFLKVNVIINMTIAAAFYFVFLYLLKEPSLKEIKMIFAAKE